MKTGKTGFDADRDQQAGGAAMEPGREDREDISRSPTSSSTASAAMEPGREDREDLVLAAHRGGFTLAAMEPGREDREDLAGHWATVDSENPPQWSPAVKTGKTDTTIRLNCAEKRAAMEPGREDREDRPAPMPNLPAWEAAMEPGREDREDRNCRTCSPTGRKPQWSPAVKTGKTAGRRYVLPRAPSRNGARP